MSPVDLSNYVDVKARIKLFYEKYPDGRVVTSDRIFTAEPDGVARIVVYAKAYRTPDDPLPGEGSSWMLLPGTSNFTRGSEIENTETSAWGRAIGATGIGIDASIATTDEIRGKESDEPEPPVRGPKEGLIGTVETKSAWLSDLALRETEAGFPVIGFLLKQGRQSVKVHADHDLANELAGLASATQLAGLTVTVWGTFVSQEFTPKGMTRPVQYQVLRMTRIHGPSFDLPLTGVKSEAESDRLFDEVERLGT